MNGYERLIKIMRAQKGKSENIFKIGIITQGFGVKAGELELFSEDLIFNQILLTGYSIDESTFIPPVKKGDKVLLLKMSEECYAVIAKLTQKE